MRKISHIFEPQKQRGQSAHGRRSRGVFSARLSFVHARGGATRRPRPTGVTAQRRAATWGRPYKNTKACPVNAVGAGHWPARRGASAIPEPPSSASLRSAPSPLEGGRLAGDRKGCPYGFTKVHLSNRRAGEGTRPYGGNQTGSVGSAEPGAKVEPQQRQFSTQTGRRRRPPTQSPAKRVCVGEEERWSERALSVRTKRGIRNPRRRSGPAGIQTSHSDFARRKFCATLLVRVPCNGVRGKATMSTKCSFGAVPGGVLVNLSRTPGEVQRSGFAGKRRSKGAVAVFAVRRKRRQADSR